MTAQVHEILIIDGEVTSMAFCPSLPEGHPRIVDAGARWPMVDPADVGLRTTACWRGYQGTWEIKAGQLLLVGLRGRFRLREGGPILADWFTGTLRIPRGRMLQYVHMGFGSVHEQELHVRIERGAVVATRVIDDRGRARDEFEIARENLPGRENRFPGDDDWQPVAAADPSRREERREGEATLRSGGRTAFHPSGAPVPVQKRTERLLVRPLRASDAELDYDAVMSSAEQLRRWSQRNWPAAGFTLAENRADLERHEREHAEGIAFTFTVMNPNATRCLGCVYVVPPAPEVDPLFADVAHAAEVGFWVRTSELPGDLDAHLLATLRSWFATEWAFDRVVYRIVRQEVRQAALMSDAGLARRAVYTRADGLECWVFG